MASSATHLNTHFIRPFPSTTSFARFPSRSVAPLIKASASDCADSGTPIPKVCPLKNRFLERGRVLPHLFKERDDSVLAKFNFHGISFKINAEEEDSDDDDDSDDVDDDDDDEDEDEDDDEDDDEEDQNYDCRRKFFGSINICVGGNEKDRIEAKMRNGVQKMVISKRKGITTIKINN